MIINWDFIESMAKQKYGPASTIELLASETGFSRQQYYNARQKDSMSIKSLVKIAKALQVDVADLFHRNGNQASEPTPIYNSLKRRYDGEILEELNITLSSIERKLDKLIQSSSDTKKP